MVGMQVSQQGRSDLFSFDTQPRKMMKQQTVRSIRLLAHSRVDQNALIIPSNQQRISTEL
jgi:hypothetical protein